MLLNLTAQAAANGVSRVVMRKLYVAVCVVVPSLCFLSARHLGKLCSFIFQLMMSYYSFRH